ncbi:DNA-3-methyladenine glycosylase 2 family protein [Crenobacter sp. SG2303]|uniref:DNA-3-methyladenine glycosylase II n=1 Tax=Crenobacter oryzisoli TaxID=3056844 RepID=A0ABT7XIG7_9NEIS|nr:DNA-3-methyladenine glycosylase 2 family protein [Crenobacter sp. SG2303]MDN0073562.1 DNA-3-methyladenine glycosylase 2 family protein [Crenobacter sp. SG2303]
MAGLIERFGGSVLKTRGEPFETLLRAIVGQQISMRAAETIWGRLTALLNDHSPAAVLAADETALRGVGLSARKVGYARDLAAHFHDGRLTVERLAAAGDEEVLAALTAVRGIGRWTAEMCLIFNLSRADIWPVDDIGVQRALAELYFHGARPSLAECRELGERWRPWRSVASWFLWCYLDPVEVNY